jgi:hypothetical protein
VDCRLKHHLCSHIFVVLLSMTTAHVAHAGCSPKLQLTFQDGSRGCLDDYPLANVKPQGFFVSAARAIPQHGYFHLAAPRNPTQCTQSLALSVAVGTNVTPSGASDGPRARVREKEALTNCQRVAGVAEQGSSCECITIVSDGQVPVSKTEFERIGNEIASPK